MDEELVKKLIEQGMKAMQDQIDASEPKVGSKARSPRSTEKPPKYIEAVGLHICDAGKVKLQKKLTKIR